MKRIYFTTVKNVIQSKDLPKRTILLGQKKVMEGRRKKDEVFLLGASSAKSLSEKRRVG